MNDSPLQIAKRETQQSFRTKPVWIALAAAGIVLGLAGPFGTDQVLRLLPRIIYWMCLTIGFYFVGSFVGTWLNIALERKNAPKWGAVIISGAIAGVVIFALLIGINVALFDVPLDCLSCLAGLGANVVVISVVVTAAVVYIQEMLQAPNEPIVDGLSEEGQGAASKAQNTQAPALLRRLPLDKRAPILSLSVSDHYVKVVTEKGTELLLMRLSDAIAETAGAAGLQVHRSHWVALSAIQSARREGAKAVLTTSDGREIPASRTYVPALKEAGVLPS